MRECATIFSHLSSIFALCSQLDRFLTGGIFGPYREEIITLFVDRVSHIFGLNYILSLHSNGKLGSIVQQVVATTKNRSMSANMVKIP